ncbi:hypothetical protein KCP75_22320 [Salmonella enterica subsp. enterica]|nr:hypothetical protein KCP75_22320 [Salmonella enterica subsp. enterica]
MTGKERLSGARTVPLCQPPPEMKIPHCFAPGNLPWRWVRGITWAHRNNLAGVGHAPALSPLRRRCKHWVSSTKTIVLVAPFSQRYIGSGKVRLLKRL